MSDEFVVEEMPDLLEEDENFEKIQATLEDLQGIYDELVVSGGVSRTYAATIESIKPETLPEHCPLESYTASETLTNYEATLEAISMESKGLLAAAIAAAVLILLRLLAWIASLFSSSSERGSQAGSTVASTFKVKAVAEESVARAVKADPRFRASVKDIEKAAAKVVTERYRSEISELGWDILTNGDTIKELRRYGRDLHKYLEIAKRRMDLITAAMSSVSGTKLRNDSDGLLKRQALSQLEIATGSENDISYNAKKFYDEVSQFYETQVKPRHSNRLELKIDPNTVDKLIKTADDNLDKDFIDQEKKTMKLYKELNAKVAVLEKTKAHGTDQDIIRAFKDAIRNVRHICMGVGLVVSGVTYAIDGGMKAAMAIRTYYSEISLQAINYLTGGDSTEEGREIAKELRKQLAEARKG